MSKEFKIGIFAISIMLISFAVINFLRGKDLLNREVEYVSVYDNVQGLVVSSPVFVKGYKVGKVIEINYDSHKGEFEVICSVGKDYKVPVDSKMTIFSTDIMGTKGIRLDAGMSKEIALDGASLTPSFESDPIAGLTESMGPVLSKVGLTLDSLNVAVESINKMLSGKNREKIDRTLTHLESTMCSLEKITSVVEGRSNELDIFIENLSDFTETLKSIATKADTTMNGLSSVVEKIDSSDITGVISSFKTLLEKINDPDGTVGKLLENDGVYDSVDSLLKDVDSLVKKIEENPKKYIKFTIF